MTMGMRWVTIRITPWRHWRRTVRRPRISPRTVMAMMGRRLAILGARFLVSLLLTITFIGA